MGYSQREDYLLRQVKAAAVMLAGITGLRTSGEATALRMRAAAMGREAERQRG